MDLKECPKCGTRVLSMSDNKCPGCGTPLADARTVQIEAPPPGQEGLKEDARCPNCGPMNPAGTVSCDCGYNFISQKTGRPKAHYRTRTPVVNVVVISTGADALGGALAIWLYGALYSGNYVGGNDLVGAALAGGFIAGALALMIVLSRRRREQTNYVHLPHTAAAYAAAEPGGK